MVVKVNPTLEQQVEAVKYISDTFDIYKDLMSERMGQYLDIYKEYSTFTQPKQSDWDTTFKVNKAHEVVNKILPRLMSKSPKWLVSYKPDIISEVEKLEWEQKSKKIKSIEQSVKAVQAYLTYVWDKYNLSEPARLWAKNMLVYWLAFAKVDFAYEIARSVKETLENESILDENWEIIGEQEVKKNNIEEYVWWEYPTINPVSWSDIYYDPRYRLFRQLPAIIEVVNGVRLSQLQQNKEKYINLDKLEELSQIPSFNEDQKWYKSSIFSLFGINLPKWKKWVDLNALSMKTYYWRYNLKEDERLYKITVVEDVVVICFEEITQIPFEQIRAFEDTETNFGWGIVEPILWLQQELNFKKNSASTYINHALNRSWFWSPNSWVNPKDLISKPNGIIPTNRTVEDLNKNLLEVPHRSIDPSYFNEQNDFERQIQAMTFTVDTSNPKTQNSLTNTATGARIKFFESNTVLDELRKHFEKWLTALWYKLLQATYENLENNIVIDKIDEDWFREINKELIKDAIKKYEIKIETGSSAYDNIEDRRDDAIAKYNLWLQAMGAWVPVDMTELFKDVLSQFEESDPNRFIKNPQMQNIMWGWNPLEAPQQNNLPWPEELTQQVAQGNITSGM